MGIKAEATAGMYSEVISQIYDSIDKRFREAVSNAYDARAEEIGISVLMGGDDKIIINDNGEGMDEDDLSAKYINLGGGDKYNNPDTIGRIGIGALSVFGLGNKVRIRTKKEASTTVLTAEILLDRIKDPGNHGVPLDKIVLGDIVSKGAPDEDDPDHFTEITITQLERDVKQIFNSAVKSKQLIDNLEKILPLKFRNDDPILNRLHADIVNKIKSNKYCIDVSMNIPLHGITNQKLFRKSIYQVDGVDIFPPRTIWPFTIEEGYNNNLRVYGYLYINSSRQLPKEWQGINARVKNVTIESNTYFDYGKDAEARRRIGGELFIENLDENHAIQSNRSGFAKENNDYIQISNYMKIHIQEAISRVRRDSDIDSLIKKFVNKLEKLRNMFEEIATAQDRKDSAENFHEIDDADINITEFPLFNLEKTIQKELSDRISCELEWSGVLQDLYGIDYDDDDFCTIVVHSKLNNIEFDVAGNTINCNIGYCNKEQPVVIKKNGQMIINLDNLLIKNRDIRKIDVDYIKVIFILYLNYLRNPDSAKTLYEETFSDLSQA